MLSGQSHDLPTGQGEKASGGCPIAAGHLQDTINPKNKLLGGDERFA